MKKIISAILSMMMAFSCLQALSQNEYRQMLREEAKHRKNGGNKTAGQLYRERMDRNLYRNSQSQRVQKKESDADEIRRLFNSKY